VAAMRRQPLSLRARISLALALLLLAGMFGLYVTAFSYGKTVADRLYDRLLASSARSTADTLTETPIGIEVDIPYSAFELLTAASDDRIFYRVFTTADRTITGYRDLPRAPRAAAAGSGSYREDARFFTVPYRGEPVRFVLIGRTILNHSGAAGAQTVWVQIGQTRRAHSALARELVLRSLAPVALMTLIAMLLVWFGIGQSLKPLRNISDELAMRTSADLDPIQTPVPAEVDLLVTALNGFMMRLGANMATLRDFVGETAHQLRTPLAALRAQAQVADRSSLADLGRALDIVERNAARLTRLITQMLTDATVSHRLETARSEPFDLIEVTREAVHEGTAFKPDIRCRLEVELNQAPLMGDPLMLAEAIRNIFDNAGIHGGGAITVVVRRAEGCYELDIADRGSGIPVALHARVFERFVRGDGQSPGAGLGLAIAQRAVYRHGGGITLLDRPGGGLIVRITLPVMV
jgi:two-component system sensor histidine kinase TctE